MASHHNKNNNNNIRWTPESTSSSSDSERSKALPEEQEKIEVLHGEESVMNAMLHFLSKADRIDCCADYRASSIAIEAEGYKKLLHDIKERGIKLRFLIDINKDNINYCKELMNFAEQIRHLEGVRAGFSISEREYIATATLNEAQPITQLIYSNLKDIVKQHQYLFETLWDTAVPAEQRIKQIEEGVDIEKTEIIHNPSTTKRLYTDLVKSAENEVLLIFPSVNAFHREHSIGIIGKLLEKASSSLPSSGNRVRIRIITPSDSFVDSISQKTVGVNKSNKKEEQENFFNIRRIDPTSDIKISSLIVDRRASLVIELKDDSKENFVDAIGSSTYSTSKPTVLSYISIFENLWRQIQLYEHLKAHDKMQKEFLNIAAHELRTPAQSIVGYTELLLTDPEYIQIDKKQGFLDAIYRNSIRLTRLTKHILDVSRIENQTLQLRKQRFSLNDIISLVIQDIQRLRQGVITGANNGSKAKAKAISLSYKSSSLSDKKQQHNNYSSAAIFVKADRERVMQVLSNLLENALKFTKENGTISVIVEVQKNQGNKKEVIISIKDTGTGIDPEIMPRLFTKFCTKPSSVATTTGTGLGLYISKSIIESHGGRIWAQNSPQGKGTTFSFSLPLSK